MIYGQSKLKATNFLLKKFKEDAFPVCVFRFYQIFGPGQDLNRFIPIVINACKRESKFSMLEWITIQRLSFLLVMQLKP